MRLRLRQLTGVGRPGGRHERAHGGEADDHGAHEALEGHGVQAPREAPPAARELHRRRRVHLTERASAEEELKTEEARLLRGAAGGAARISSGKH